MRGWMENARPVGRSESSPNERYKVQKLAYEDLSKLRVAIVHYWFVGWAGGEQVVEALAEMFPQADLFALVARPQTMPLSLHSHRLTTSFLQSVPGAKKFHRQFIFLHPIALEQFDLSGYDLVISSESGPAKGVITSPRTCHICYCHSPMRYIWDMHAEYTKRMGALTKPIFRLSAHYLRLWDYATAGRVDYFVANSRFVASRIRKIYGRESTVIYPPVDANSSHVSPTKGDYYLSIGRLVDYKHFDLAVEACRNLGRKLRIIGEGPQSKLLHKLAGPTIEFMGHVDREVLKACLADCRAFLFPAEEDFGIAAVEAQSYGRAVIAYGSGGGLETVRGEFAGNGSVEGQTGVFFPMQTVQSLTKAILDFESREREFDSVKIREHALQFDRQVFKRKMADFILSVWDEFQSRV